MLFSIVMMCSTGLIASGLQAYSLTAFEYPGGSSAAADRLYLAAGYTDKDEQATIGDPGKEATIGDPGEEDSF